MGGEDLIDPSAFSKSEYMSKNDGPHESSKEADSLLINSVAEKEINRVVSEVMPDDACQSGFEALESERSPGKTTAVDEIDIEMIEEAAVVKAVVTDNGSVGVESDIVSSNHKLNGTTISGVKRPRITFDEQEPSVRVIYNCLTRESKRKLEELLQQWSRWHGENCSLSNDSKTVTESGEETYFPALRVGLDKPSQVTFWVDSQTKSQSNKDFVPLDGTSVPLYDRGYSLALTSDGSSGLQGEGEKLDASRCFNCSSYGHALRDCPMPRDNAAVSNARKQHRSQRNQSVNSRNSARYYQSSRGGKYEGLTPGVLDPETRQILGLGELDPPPWLNRMRDIGYPPGYLDPDVEDQPSGITIFGDEPTKEEGEEGEIVGAISPREPTRKMSVEFPGINAPIPANASERLWAPPSSADSILPRERSHHRGHSYLPETVNRVSHHEPRWSADLDDERPPGTDPWTSPSLANHFRRHGEYDRETNFTSHSNRDHIYNSPRANPSPWSPGHSRSLSDRGRRTPSFSDRGRRSPHDEYRPHGAYPHSYPR